MALRTSTALIGALALVAVVPETFEDGAKAYREGRFADAVRIFKVVEAEAEDAAAFALRYDLALSAWRAGDLKTADDAARRAGEAPGADLGTVAFLRGAVSWTRALRAEGVAAAVESEPFAYDAAISAAVLARDAWRTAATTRDDWPEARRNAERAVRYIEVLRAKKKAAEDARKKTDTRPTEKPEDPPDPARPNESAARVKETSSVALSPEQIRRLVERLDALEKEKRGVRLKERSVVNATTERDW